MALEIQLLSTSGCHLCDVALRMIRRLSSAQDIQISTIDIAEDDQMVEQYGMKIPVLRCDTFNKELEWPFDEQQYLNWLEDLANS